MSAPKACPRHFWPKQCLGKGVLRECSSRKRDNVVLIEVDSDDFGDVIILDVPDSFHRKFNKKPKHVISIDDDDDDDDDGDENKASSGAACNSDCDATASVPFPPTSATPSFDSTDVDCVSFGEGVTPVKLSKSKRTYSGKSVSRNRYGLCSDDDCSSDNDGSDCEFMGVSSEMLNEQLKKASFSQSHDRSPGCPENKADSSIPNIPAHNITEEVTSEHLEPCSRQSNFSKCSVGHEQNDALDEDDSANINDFNDSEEMDKEFVVDNSANLNDFWNVLNEVYRENDSVDIDDSTKEMDEVFVEDNINKPSHMNINGPASTERDDCVEEPFSQSEDVSLCGDEAHVNEAKISDDQSFVILDRQKMKETDSYKRAMEEEWASRQQQLQLQAEEARKLRDRKRAENLRIKANEKRQMQRLDEMRETRRKDEENLYLKDKLRAEIRNELRRLERMCGDMSSLLRCLGIHIASLCPSASEIQAAYKRACLKFHPDRYAKSDLRQQVEAEEKFKLISNMKDKFRFT